MELTRRQKEALHTIKSVIYDWEHTNDIQSPSHAYLLEQEITKFEEEFCLSQATGLEDELWKILNIIRDFK